MQGITDLITTPGLINLDFADVKSVMQGAGSALMGIGSSRGADRAIKAAELAVASPLLEASIDGAHGVLLSIQGGSNLGIFEINDAAKLVQDAVHPEANIIFGAVIDDTLGDEVRVTVIAAGFDGGEPNANTPAADTRRGSFVANAEEVDPFGRGAVATATLRRESRAAEPAEEKQSSWSTTPASSELGRSDLGVTGAVALDPASEDDDTDLDVPDFLK